MSHNWEVYPIDSNKECTNTITSLEVKMITLDGCGHNVQYSEPKLFSIKLKELLKNK